MFEILTNLNLLLIIVLIVLLYFFFTRNHNYWKSRGISGPKPLPLFGNLLEVFYKPLSIIEEERFKKFGRIHGFYDLNEPILTVGEPELVKQILVKDFSSFINRRNIKIKRSFVNKFLIVMRDDDWKRVRAITSPTFSSGKIKKMFTLINDCANGVLKKLTQLADNKAEVDLKWLFGSYTMDVIAKCAFATNTNALEDRNNAFVKFASKVINVPLWRQIFTLVMPGFVLNALKFTIAPPDAFGFFRNVAKHVLKERKSKRESNTSNYNDFLQLLVDAEKPNENALEEMSESSDEVIANANTFKFNSNEYKKLSEEEIIANIVLFLVAGYETTASLLSYSTYNLALNPKSQEKLYEEIKSCVDLNYDTVSKLPYLDAVVCETLRLHNPVTRVEREANEDYDLGNTGIKLKKHSIVAIPIHAIHHDPEYYPNPHEFRPERFFGEEKNNVIPYTYLPFGGGPRNCIGMRFALVEAKLALAKVILRFKFIKSVNTEIPLKYTNTRPGLLQAINIVVKVEKRS